MLSGVRSVGGQYQVAKLLDRNDVDGTSLNQLEDEIQPAVGSTVHRGGDDTAQAIATDGGGDVWRVHQMDLDVDSEALASNLMRHNDGVDVSRVVEDLETLQSANVEGTSDLARMLSAANADGIRGHAFEAQVAAGAVRHSDRDVVRVGQDVKSSRGSTEIDVQFADGSTVEVKSGPLVGDDIDQLRTQLMYRSENRLGGNHYVAVRGEISDDAQTFIDENNIRVLDEAEYKG